MKLFLKPNFHVLIIHCERVYWIWKNNSSSKYLLLWIISSLNKSFHHHIQKSDYLIQTILKFIYFRIHLMLIHLWIFSMRAKMILIGIRDYISSLFLQKILSLSFLFNRWNLRHNIDLILSLNSKSKYLLLIYNSSF